MSVEEGLELGQRPFQCDDTSASESGHRAVLVRGNIVLGSRAALCDKSVGIRYDLCELAFGVVQPVNFGPEPPKRNLERATDEAS